jgi:hypothetical protein
MQSTKQLLLVDNKYQLYELKEYGLYKIIAMF